ncbi:MAG TPA: CBS domain-containing protein, partial [Rariglobus sp.]
GMVACDRLLDWLRLPLSSLDAPLPPSVVEPAPTVAPGLLVETALDRMARLGHRELVVTDDAGRFLGLLSVLDAVVDFSGPQKIL